MAETFDGPAGGHRVRLIPILMALAVGAFGVFALPWFVPFRQPINSLSYTYGFNNTAAWMAVAALLTLTCLARLVKRGKAGSTTMDRILSGIVAENTAEPDSRLFAMFLVVALTGAVLQLLCYTLLPSNDFGEVGQHTARLDLMLLGLRPHADFHYIFGPGMLYAAYGLFRLGGGAFSIDAAYCATLMADWVIGVFLLYYIVKNLGGEFKKTAVFLCVSAVFFSPTMMAYQYTPVRYFLPLASLLVVHQSVSRQAFGTAVAAAVLLPLAALAFSPDAGIATTAALLAYFVMLVRTPLRKYSVGAMACGLAAALGLTAFGTAYLDSIRSHSNSVSAFPVFPTLTVLAFLSAVIAIVPAFVCLGLCQPTPAGSLALGMAIALSLEVPPALGRCDLMHISWNGAGMLLVALSALTAVKTTRAMHRMVLCGYLAIFPLSSLTAMMWHSYGEAVLRFLHGNATHAEHEAVAASLTEPTSPRAVPGLVAGIHSPYAKPKHFSPDLQALLRYQKIGLPFGASEEIRRFLKMNGRFAPEYWPETFSYLGNEADIASKLRDLKTMDVILVPREVYLVDNFMTIPIGPDLRLPTSVDPAVHRATAKHILTTVTLFPVWLPGARKAPLLPEMRIMAEVAKRYRADGQFRDFIIAVKRESPGE
jgi:hypothetical protein